jgi:cytochrome bd-type quinol oxidase subunit 2
VSVPEVAAVVFAAVTGLVVLFQLALAGGAPWGQYAMGGKFKGKYPAGMRIAAVVQAAFLVLTGCVVMARAGLLLGGWASASKWLIWVVVALNAVGLVLNLITPSKGERLRWAPAAAVLLAACLVVALAQ